MGILIGIGSGQPSSAYDYYYGTEFDYTVRSTSGVRVGRPELNASCPIQSRMKRCILKDTGEVAYYLGESDSTKTSTGGTAKLDGTDGQVMVEIPSHYRRFEFEGTKIRALISEYPLPGFELVPTMYISAYEATIARSTQTLSSVASKDPEYRGGNNNSGLDGDLTGKTQLGVPATQTSLTNFRAYAKKRGEKWIDYAYEAHLTLFWLFTIEYATSNCQLPYNEVLTPEGYHQGGLGEGVTTLTGGGWSNMNGYYPFVPCGTTNSLGNKTGYVNFNVPSGYGQEKVVQVPSYRGVENPFGHLWKWLDGVLAVIQSATSGGESRAYKARNLADFTSSMDGISSYAYIGNLPRTNGYVMRLLFGEGGEFLPAEIGASATTWWSDYFYTSVPENGESLRGLLVGGSAANGTLAGLAYVNSNTTPSNTTANLGSRLCFFP